MTSRRGRALAGTTAAVLLLAAAWAVHRRDLARVVPERPRYIFVNRTSRHDHDLALKLSLKLAEKRSGIENALVLLDRLPPDTSIEQLAEQTFRRWQIGGDRSGRGILYLYSEQENRFKIEVSYSLEERFPDAVCHQLEEAARAYMLSEVPQDFLSELLITMNLHGQAASAGSLDLTPPAWTRSLHPSGGAGVEARGYHRNFEDYQQAIQTLSETEARDYQPSSDPAETTTRYLRSLEQGLGEPQLPLLTEGSRVFRMIVPRNGAQQRRIREYFRRAMPYELSRQDDWGLVVFRPGVPNLPIVLRRSRDGLWFVDEPKSWTYFHRFEDGVDFVPKYDDLPVSRALRETNHPNASRPIYPARVPTPTPRAYPFSLGAALRELEEAAGHDSDPARAYARIGELYLFEMNWITEAIRLFERAAGLAPRRPEYHWRLYDLYLNNSEGEKMLAELKTLSELLPEDAEVKQWLEYYSGIYRFPPGEFFEEAGG